MTICAINHSQKGWRRATSFQFAVGMTEVFLARQEIEHAALSFPIVFRNSGSEWTALAILGLQTDRNLFVTQDGQWIANYVPALLRAYPFRLNRSGDDLELWPSHDPIALDANGAEPFYTDGEYAPLVRRTLSFLQSVHAGIALFTETLDLLDRHDLLVPAEASNLGVSASDAFMLDRIAFESASDELWLHLRRLQAIGWLQSHASSLLHVGRLQRLLEAHSSADPLRRRFSEEDNNDLQGFLAAIAQDVESRA
jgi:hypothetical protein